MLRHVRVILALTPQRVNVQNSRRSLAQWNIRAALAQAASSEGFRVLLTRDRRFGVSAGSTLEALP